MPTLLDGRFRLTEAWIGYGHNSNTWLGTQDTWQFSASVVGVFKKRQTVTIEGAENDADATYNVSPESLDFSDFDLKQGEGNKLIGGVVKIGWTAYRIIRADFANNYRTGKIDHIRLYLREGALK